MLFKYETLFVVAFLLFFSGFFLFREVSWSLFFNIGLVLWLGSALLFLVLLVLYFLRRNAHQLEAKSESMSHLDDHIAAKLNSTSKELETVLLDLKALNQSAFDLSGIERAEETAEIIKKQSTLYHTIDRLQAIKTELEVYLSVRNKLRKERPIAKPSDPHQRPNSNIDPR